MPLLSAAGLDKKAKHHVKVVKPDPFANPPAYESLVGNLLGYCSRRISIQRRFVYQASRGSVKIDGKTYDGIVKVVRMCIHYECL